MSWSDDMRCLYCDGKLPLYRKITNGQFCSASHRKAYWQEQGRLAVERLHQTHNSLRAYRPAAPLEMAGGPEPGQLEPVEPAASGLIVVRPAPTADHLPAMMAADPCHYETQFETLHPHWIPQPFEADSLAMRDQMPIPASPDSKGPEYRAIAVQPDRLEWITAPVRPSLGLSVHHGQIPAAELERLADEQIPSPATMIAMPRIAACEAGADGDAARQPQPAVLNLRAQLPPDPAREDTKIALALGQPGLKQLPVDRIPLVQGAWIESLRPLDSRNDSQAPELILETPARRPRLHLAPGRRYPVEVREGAVAAAELETGNYAAASPHISLPRRNVLARAATASAGGAQGMKAAEPNLPGPGTGGLLALELAAGTGHGGEGPTQTRPSPPPLTQPLQSAPVPPESKLEPLDAKPVSDLIASPAAAAATQAPATPDRSVHVWMHTVDFWKNAPRDLKLLAFGIPVLLGLALRPSLPKVRVTAPPAADSFERALSAKWTNVRQTMVDRAAVALDEDFRTGLDEWTSRGNATASWSFDATGFVRPGALALYRPSLGLTDYQMQFLGLIDKKAMSWVVRAADFDNYYVVKLVVLKPGPLPTIGVTRYAVVNGKAQNRADVVVPINARPDMLYRVRLDVHGDIFALAVQGQMVDSWSEPRLRHGGVGFFSARGEESRVRWIQVTHQYDMFGRLCAYLAPYNITSTNGSSQQ